MFGFYLRKSLIYVEQHREARMIFRFKDVACKLKESRMFSVERRFLRGDINHIIRFIEGFFY